MDGTPGNGTRSLVDHLGRVENSFRLEIALDEGVVGVFRLG